MEVRYLISEEEAQYQNKHRGHFSKKLAEWAISMMEKEDDATGKMKRIVPTPLDMVEEVLQKYKVEIPEECIYDAYYLFNMAKADYTKTCKTDEQRATFVEETICDPDGCPESVLACFCAKMDLKDMPIHWERFL